METNKFIRTKQAIQLSDLEKLEVEFNLKFPDIYKDHLLQYNGGVPERNIFTTKAGEKFILHSFFSVLYGNVKLEDVIRITQVWEDVIPKDLLPFANDPFGNDYCISLNPEDYGKIYIYLHDVGGRKEFVADSFEEFLENTESNEALV